jgi:ubiquinone/menaquinone biosynthesis C-methylase UbiE/capsular polysaccharide biosynthesis protein
MPEPANSTLATLQNGKDLLSAEALEKASDLWQATMGPPAREAYATDAYQRPFEEYLERIRHLGLSGNRLVDAGCGGGAWSFAWATRFDHVLGFDISLPTISAANRRKERLGIASVDFERGDIRNISVADDSIDTLYCNDVISSLLSIESALREIFRVLKAEGVCYLGFTGPGSTYQRMKSGDPRVAELARKRIYNTLCKRHLTPLVSVIGPGWARNIEAAAGLRRQTPVAELLAFLGCDPDQIPVAETVSSELGEEFSSKLIDDLAAITSGAKASFGDSVGGRDWNADEVSIAAREAGFGRIECAPEGWLSLKAGGSIEKAPCESVRSRPHKFEGRHCAFEMLLWKPAKQAPRATHRLDDHRLKPAAPTRVRRTPEEGWKFKWGKNTYWNAKSRALFSPIIDSTAPVMTELEGAIITPRHVGPAGGPFRVATGGIYDRHHNLLPVFIEREEYEADKQHFMRFRNELTLTREKVENAQVLRGTYIYLGILRNHFGHFLLETLSHAWYILRDNPDSKVIFLQYENLGVLPSFARYAFDLIGLNPERIVLLTRTSIVERLIFPDSEFEIRWKARASYAEIFRELFERSSRAYPVENTPKHLYLTRRRLKPESLTSVSKIIVNEQAVETLFADRGYTIIAPETLPFHQQIALVGGAREIGGLKGSALHLSLFCQDPNARLIQIGREQLMNQSLIDGLKDMESHHIFCDFSRTDTGSVVDLDTIAAALREM